MSAIGELLFYPVFDTRVLLFLVNYRFSIEAEVAGKTEFMVMGS